MSINILVSPPSAPQRPPPVILSRSSRRHQPETLADQILKYVSDAGANPTGRWELVRSLGPSEGSASTEELKNGRVEVLHEIEALIRAGRLVRLGRLAVQLPPRPGEAATPWPRTICDRRWLCNFRLRQGKWPIRVARLGLERYAICERS